MAIQQGDVVKVEYEGKLENGEVFDTTEHEGHSHPIEFEVGSGKVIQGFEQAVEGMEKGQEKEFSLSPEEAYGERKEEFKKEVPKSSLPQDQEPKEGMMLVAKSPNGQQFPAKIVSVGDESITIDLNHPLAGKELFFKIKVVDVNPPKEESSEANENEETQSEESQSEEGSQEGSSQESGSQEEPQSA